MTAELKTPSSILQYNNIVPFLLLIASFFMYLNRMSIAETKLDIIITNQSEDRAWRKQFEQRLGQNETDIKVLQKEMTIHK